MELLLQILLIEFISLSTVTGVILVIHLYNKLILSVLVKKPKEQNVYANNEENIYETGFLRDMEDYDTRIDDLREQLNQTKGTAPFMPSDLNPSVEIITDDYERMMEHK